jgi:hypothetical protein
MKQHPIRFDRVASEMNVWLLAIAMGLVMLNFTVLVAKYAPPPSTASASACAEGLGQVVLRPIPPKIEQSRS